MSLTANLRRLRGAELQNKENFLELFRLSIRSFFKGWLFRIMFFEEASCTLVRRRILDISRTKFLQFLEQFYFH